MSPLPLHKAVKENIRTVMSEDQVSANPDEQQSRTLKFDYIKSNYFRVVHADGVWGDVTPNSSIHIAFWNERFPIPKRVTYEIGADGTISDSKTSTRRGIVREVEVGVILDVETAKILVSWLQDRVEEIESELEEEE